MNLAFYSALDRIPLGIAVTFEFVGPLGVAVFGSRRPLDLVWVVVAAAGILLLSDFGGADLDGVGVALALLAGGFWAAYILLSVRVGRAFPGGSGLALAMLVATVPLAPIGIAEGGADLLSPSVLAIGFAVGMMSSAIPYTLELEALRRMPAGVFGVLMSLEPALAATAGFIVLGEDLAAREVVAIALVVAASAGAAQRRQIAAPGTPELAYETHKCRESSCATEPRRSFLLATAALGGSRPRSGRSRCPTNSARRESRAGQEPPSTSARFHRDRSTAARTAPATGRCSCRHTTGAATPGSRSNAPRTAVRLRWHVEGHLRLRLRGREPTSRALRSPTPAS